ncbi:MAG: adenosylcobinamide-phosphate synthase CbiB [Nitrospirota bacterium]
MPETFQDILTFLSRPYSLLVLAFVLDLCIGDPAWFPHPVRAMGWVITRLEDLLRYRIQNADNRTQITEHRLQNAEIKEKWAGILLVVIITDSTFALFYIVDSMLLTFHFSLFTSYFSLLVMVYLISTTLAVKGLTDSADDVIAALVDKNITDARIKAGYIVGRDTDSLNEKGIIRATIESLAENASDGIVAPVFYFAIGGLPLAMTYKAINTMDSMLGYKNDRYRYFGWAAARLDDIANYIPARIAGILIVISAFIIGGLNKLKNNSSRSAGLNRLNGRNALKVMLRDGGNHSSPNSGIPEAAMAGALGVMLGGPSTYGGVLVEKQYIGKEMNGDYSAPSKSAVNIVRITSFLCVAIAVMVLLIRAWHV